MGTPSVPTSCIGCRRRRTADASRRAREERSQSTDAAATNGLNLNLDYEAVYNKAVNADYWVNVGFAKSLAEIKSADKKNVLFKAYKNGNVYNNSLRNTANGGFDFWESGAVNPDKILKDLIYIFHPEVLPGHQLYYYRKLK